MAKSRTLYFCNKCGAETSQWFGKCPECGTYNSLEEQLVSPAPAGTVRGNWQGGNRGNSKSAPKPAQPRASLTFAEIVDGQEERWFSGYEELDRVLGGGIVPGSLVLIGGDPGIGKSTLLLQVANRLSSHYRILYVCGEESGKQVKLRASRLGVGVEDAEEAEEGGKRPHPLPLPVPRGGEKSGGGKCYCPHAC